MQEVALTFGPRTTVFSWLFLQHFKEILHYNAGGGGGRGRKGELHIMTYQFNKQHNIKLLFRHLKVPYTFCLYPRQCILCGLPAFQSPTVMQLDFQSTTKSASLSMDNKNWIQILNASLNHDPHFLQLGLIKKNTNFIILYLQYSIIKKVGIIKNKLDIQEVRHFPLCQWYYFVAP